MFNPQLEDGYTSIANELFEEIIRLDASGQQFRVLFAVIRKLYGFHRKEDWLSNSQIALITGLPIKKVSMAVQFWVDRNVLTIPKNEDGRVRVVRFNKHYGTWQPSPKTRIPSPKTGITKEIDSSIKSLDSKKTKVFNTLQACFSMNDFLDLSDYWNSKVSLLPVHATPAQMGVVFEYAQELVSLYLIDDIRRAIDLFSQTGDKFWSGARTRITFQAFLRNKTDLVGQLLALEPKTTVELITTPDEPVTVENVEKRLREFKEE